MEYPIWIVQLSHPIVSGTVTRAFTTEKAAREAARDHVGEMYAERWEVGTSLDPLPDEGVTLDNWGVLADALDEYEGDGYVCVNFDGPINVEGNWRP